MEHHAVITHFEKQEEEWLRLNSMDCTRLHARISKDKCREYSRNNPEACSGCAGATAPAAPKTRAPWRQEAIRSAEKRKALQIKPTEPVEFVGGGILQQEKKASCKPVQAPEPAISKLPPDTPRPPKRPPIKPHVMKMLQIMAKRGNQQAKDILNGKAA